MYHSFLIGIHSKQGLTATIKSMGLLEKEERKEERHIRKLIRKNPTIKGAY